MRQKNHPSPCTPVHRQALLVNGSYRSHPLYEVHIARLGDLFNERYKIIHKIISQVVRLIIRPEQITCRRQRHCQLFVGRVYKNVCKTTQCNDVIHIATPVGRSPI